jgi:UPF0755 protein
MKKKIIFLIFSIFIISLSLFYFWYSIYFPIEVGSKREIVFEIRKGEGGKEISKNLKKEGLIRFGIPFRLYTYFRGVARKLQSGSYLLSPSMTIPQIVEKFVKGDVIKEKITILEGWNRKEIAKYLEEKGVLKAEDFLEKTKLIYWKEKYDFLREIDAPDLEGFLFPDTYFIEYSTNFAIAKNVVLAKEEEIIKKMLDNFDKKLTPQLREEISHQGKTIFQIVTMASMLEREVKDFEDKKLVSGILWKRLENGIPLQVDATITFITGKKTTQITLEDLQIDSPYNTYKYKGLPPGPISNPGFDSILAAIYPEKSDYWYYLSTPDGKTIFSKTLQEHNLVKAKYLK